MASAEGGGGAPSGREFPPAEDMRQLRRVLKSCEVGTGEIARAIESCTFPLSERGFTMLQVSCRRSGRWKKALEIFQTIKGEEMCARGVRPNFYTYSSLISVLCASGVCSQALEILKEMREAGEQDPSVRPDAEIYDSLIGACHKKLRYADVLALYDTMVQELKLEPSCATSISALQAYGELKVWERALGMLDELLSRGVDIPLSSYTDLLSCCADQGAYKEAVEIFLAMQMSEVVPDQIACHHMIQAAAKAMKSAVCLDMVRSMWSAGVTITPLTFSSVLELQHKHKLKEDAKEVLAIVKEAGLMSLLEKWKPVFEDDGEE